MLEPFRLHVERRRQHQDVRICRLLQMRDAVFRHHEGAAGVDAHHQVEPLHVGRLRIGQADGAGVVDADIDAAEFGDGLVDRVDHLGLVADIAEDRQRLAAGGADLVGGGVDGALQFRMRLRGLGGDRDIGAVARGAQRDRKPDAAAAAGYEQRLALERCHRFLLAVLPADCAFATYCPAASAPRVRGSGAPSNPFGVTAIELAEVWPIGSTTSMALGPQRGQRVLGKAALDPDLVRQPLMVQPRRGDRGGDIHVVVEHIDDHLQHRGDDAAAARRSRHQHRLAVLQHDGRRHRRQRPLAGPGQIGLEADQAEGVGGAGRRGEIVELVVEQHAGAFGDQADAVGKIQRIGVADRVALAVDHREMRGVAAFARRQRRQRIGPRRRVVEIDAGALFGRVILRQSAPRPAR